MRVEKVKVIFNDDGGHKVDYKGKALNLGDIRETVRDVEDGLGNAGFKTSLTPLKEGGLEGFLEDIRRADYDVVFNLCEGAFNKSSFEANVAALLELYGVRFTGNSSLTLGVALNKGWTKEILKGAGIPTAGYMVVENPRGGPSDAIKFPVIVKPLMEDASIGINPDSVVWSQGELEQRAQWILKEFGQPAIVEEYIDGREFNVAILGNGKDARALPASEIDFSNYPEGLPKICGFDAKWIESSPLYISTPPVCPADIGETVRRRLEEISLGAYRALSCRDYARVDMRMDKNGEIKVLEVNPNPDISVNAGFARAAFAADLRYHELIKAIVGLAQERSAA